MSFQGRANQGKPSTSASLRLQSDLRSMRVEPPEVSFTISLFRVGRSQRAHQCASLFSVKRVRFRSRALFCFKEREGCRSAFSFVGVASVDDGDDDVRVVVLARWFHRIFFFIIFLFFFSFLFLLLFAIQLKMKRYVGYIGITALGGQFVRLVGDGMRTAG